MPFFDEALKLKRSKNGPFSDAISELYMKFNELPLPKEVSCPERLMDYFNLIYTGAHQPFPKYNLTFDNLSFMRPSHNPKDVVVGFSGGKDSLAAAIKCKMRGLEPRLFFVKGINKSYPGEELCALTTAEASGFKFQVETVTPPSKSSFKEHPMKDQMILSMMLDYGVSEEIYQFTMGVEETNKAETSNILYNWSDSVDMFYLFMDWAGSEFPDCNWFWCITHHSESIALICKYDFLLLPMTTSCLTPHRFQKMRREAVQEDYGIELVPNRCGTCWKCCVEYLNLLALDKVEYQAGFFKRCFTKFEENLKTAYGPSVVGRYNKAEVLDLAVDPRFIDNVKLVKFLEI